MAEIFFPPTTKQMRIDSKYNKFALLWGEAQKKIAYTYSYLKVT